VAILDTAPAKFLQQVRCTNLRILFVRWLLQCGHFFGFCCGPWDGSCDRSEVEIRDGFWDITCEGSLNGSDVGNCEGSCDRCSDGYCDGLEEKFMTALTMVILKRIFYSILQYLIQTLLKEIQVVLHPSWSINAKNF